MKFNIPWMLIFGMAVVLTYRECLLNAVLSKRNYSRKTCQNGCHLILSSISQLLILLEMGT